MSEGSHASPNAPDTDSTVSRTPSSSRTLAPQPTPKLRALTALRFGAAAAIVLHHARGSFGIPASFLAQIPLDQAVSLFFVLSGFILTYVYPELSTRDDTRRFLRARFARVWPGHVAAFVLFLALIGTRRFPPGTTVANLLMLHSLIPDARYFFSFNSVSWSISTEFCFYLCFPFLVANWRRSWWWKLGLAFALLLSLIALSNALALPRFPGSFHGVSSTGVVYIHPFARVLEFVLGMCACLAWRELRPRIAYGAAAGTLIELAALALVAWNLARIHAIGVVLASAGLGEAGQLWNAHAGALLSFAVLVPVLALERGWISRALSVPAAVFLGEISYSIYLLHQILLRHQATGRAGAVQVPPWFGLPVYCATLLLLSHLVWKLVECPARARLAEPSRSSRKAPERNRKSDSRLVVVELAALAALMAVAVRAPLWFGS